MEFKAKRDSLLATLYWTQSIVERRNTMPILANVLVEAQRGSIRITATDLEVGVRGEVEGDIVKEGTVTINAKKIYEIIREVPNRAGADKTLRKRLGGGAQRKIGFQNRRHGGKRVSAVSEIR